MDRVVGLPGCRFELVDHAGAQMIDDAMSAVRCAPERLAGRKPGASVAEVGLGAVGGAGERLAVMTVGLVGRAVRVVGDRVVDVDVPRHSGRVGEGVDRVQQMDPLLDPFRELVGVDADPLGEVDDRLDGDVAVPDEPAQLVEGVRGETFHPSHAGAGVECGLVQVDIEDSSVAKPARL